MNKKLIIAALTLIFILAFTGCGKDSKASGECEDENKCEYCDNKFLVHDGNLLWIKFYCFNLLLFFLCLHFPI